MTEIPPLTVFPTYAWCDHELTARDLRVLGVLCARFNRATGQCNPSQADIAEHTGYSDRTVRKALIHLRELGYVGWITDKTRGGWKLRNSYELFRFVAGSYVTPVPDVRNTGFLTDRKPVVPNGAELMGSAHDRKPVVPLNIEENRELEQRTQTPPIQDRRDEQPEDQPLDEEPNNVAPWLAEGLTWLQYAARTRGGDAAAL